MSALADIRKAIADHRAARLVSLLGRKPKLVVKVGPSAMRSICCATHDMKVPVQIDDCVVEKTKDFNGWDLVER